MKFWNSVFENIEKKLGYGGAATTYLGIENGVILNVVVQIATMYCYGRFNRRSAKHLHSSSKNTKKKNTGGDETEILNRL